MNEFTPVLSKYIARVIAGEPGKFRCHVYDVAFEVKLENGFNNVLEYFVQFAVGIFEPADIKFFVGDVGADALDVSRGGGVAGKCGKLEAAAVKVSIG